MNNNKQTTNFTFSCEYQFKIIGNNNIAFEGIVLAIIRKHSPDLSETAIKLRKSKNGAYQSMTVTITAQSKEQLDSIYHELSTEKEILFVL